VVATIVLGFLWIFYELVVILAYERWVAHTPPHTHIIKLGSLCLTTHAINRAGMRPDKDDF
jgi:hypothetical protein